jgi:hypothetical protein
MERDIIEIAKERSRELQYRIIPIIDQIAIVHIRKANLQEPNVARDAELEETLVFLSKQLSSILGLW